MGRGTVSRWWTDLPGGLSYICSAHSVTSWLFSSWVSLFEVPLKITTDQLSKMKPRCWDILGMVYYCLFSFVALSLIQRRKFNTLFYLVSVFILTYSQRYIINNVRGKFRICIQVFIFHLYDLLKGENSIIIGIILERTKVHLKCW